jgi:hypothetical protein
MRILTTIFLLILTTICQGQFVIGKYSNYFGESFYFEEDSTFKYTWLFDLASSWTNGSWKISNDTLYIEPKIILDTLRTLNSHGIEIDTLVVSTDEIQNRTDSIAYISSFLSGGGQNRRIPPSKLHYKNKRLYLILENGKLDRRKKSFLTRKRYKTYFIEVE